MYDKMLAIGLKPFGEVGSFNFTLNSLTQLPNVLVETAFLSNPEDEMLLLDDGFRKKVAEQIVKGLEEFVRTYAEVEIKIGMHDCLQLLYFAFSLLSLLPPLFLSKLY